MGDSQIILASGSASRRAMLEQVGLIFEVVVKPVDEVEIRESLRAEGASAGDVAVALSELKAQRVSRTHPDALVIGSDQMLDCGGIWFEKPADRDHARAHLQALSGRDHHILTGVVICQGGQRIWHHLEKATLSVRPLSETFIDDYLDRLGDSVLSSVGAYQLEGLGAQIFSKIQGDYFTILGLPLLPLLTFLRDRKVLPA